MDSNSSKVCLVSLHPTHSLNMESNGVSQLLMFLHYRLAGAFSLDLSLASTINGTT
jgi:hypothetical protein